MNFIVMSLLHYISVNILFDWVLILRYWCGLIIAFNIIFMSLAFKDLNPKIIYEFCLTNSCIQLLYWFLSIIAIKLWKRGIRNSYNWMKGGATSEQHVSSNLSSFFSSHFLSVCIFVFQFLLAFIKGKIRVVHSIQVLRVYAYEGQGCCILNDMTSYNLATLRHCLQRT